jgi:hypothetical protein
MAAAAKQPKHGAWRGGRHQNAVRPFGLILAVMAAIAILPSAALASSPVALDGPQNGDSPLVAYDPVSATTFVAWSDNQAPDNGVELCVLPAGASSCSGGGPVLLSVSSAQNPVLTGDNTISLGGLVVLPGGNVVVVGTPVETGSVAWESSAGGAAFLSAGQGLQNGGNFISPVSLFYTFNNAVALNGTDVGLLDDYGDYFSDSAVSGPESPAIAASNSNQGNGGLYPRKGYGTSGPEVAAEAAPAPAPAGTDIVVGVGDNYAGPNTTLPGCINSSGTGYGVSVGAVNGTSNAAGTLNGEGLPGYGRLACSAEDPVLASGGDDGIGVLENEGDGISGAGSTYTLDYRPFAATATGGGFGAPVLLANLTGKADELQAVDDSRTGVYAMWSEDGVHLDYSPNGGATWDGPVVVPELSNGADPGAPVIAGVGNGAVELAYDNNLGTGDRVYVQEVDAIPAPAPTLPSSGTTTSTTASFTISCAAGSTCAGTSTVTVPRLPTKAAAVARVKAITLGSAKFSIKARHKGLVTIHLNKLGKRLVSRDHGRFTAKVLISEKFNGHTLSRSRSVKFRPKRKKK